MIVLCNSLALCLQETAQNANQAVLSDKEKADKVRMGAHLALALAYLPIDVPGPQDKLSIRPFQDPNAMSDGQDDDSAAAVADAMYHHTRKDLKMQASPTPKNVVLCLAHCCASFLVSN